jgi:uncharacterized protein YbbK (DUF523 family)
MLKPIIALSGCLLGEEIRYDGQHKRNSYIVEELGQLFDYLSFCPEVTMGLGIPRKTIHIRKIDGNLRLTDTENSDVDHTDLAYETFEKMWTELREASGFIFTKGSPSCGYDPVKLFDEKGSPLSKTRGLWAQFIEEKFPLVPKIDSARLDEYEIRKNFQTQVMIYFEWNKLEKSSKSLMDFHEEKKKYLLQYGESYLEGLEKIIHSSSIIQTVFEQYQNYLFGKVFKSEITL